MKRQALLRTIDPVLAVTVFLLVMVPGVALASGPAWRPTYDLVMKWVNFIILAAIIVKYAREPIKNFLSQQQGDVLSEMKMLEEEKARIVEQIETVKAQTSENELKLAELKARLIAQGEARKQKIMEQARSQSTIMIEETRKKTENRILQAKEKLKMELADMAFDQVAKTLPRIMTDADNQRLLRIYMQGMHMEQDLP